MCIYIYIYIYILHNHIYIYIYMCIYIYMYICRIFSGRTEGEKLWEVPSAKEFPDGARPPTS